MNSYNNAGKFGGKPSFGGNNRGGAPFKKPFTRDGFAGGRNPSDRPQVLHKASCSECGNPCEVPFRPTQGKPVLCNNCFAANRNSGDNTGFRSNRVDTRPTERPQRFEKPVFQSQERSTGERVMIKSGFEDTKPIQEMKRTIESLSQKIEKMYSLLETILIEKETKSEPKKSISKKELVFVAKEETPKIAKEKKTTKVVEKTKSVKAEKPVVKKATKKTK